MEKSNIEAEWCLLQNQFESYEKHSLFIKLASILVAVTAVLTGTTSILLALLLAVLWLQDAVWKTFQSRIEPRLLQIETSIAQGSDMQPFQFNSEYQKVRRSGTALITEYCLQAVRPTVAFPHIVLMLVLMVQYAIS